MFALVIIPMFGAVGIAIDFSRANSARTAMQSALDSTALMLSKEAPKISTRSELEKKADKYFRANSPAQGSHHITIKPDLENDRQKPVFALSRGARQSGYEHRARASATR